MARRRPYINGEQVPACARTLRTGWDRFVLPNSGRRLANVSARLPLVNFRKHAPGFLLMSATTRQRRQQSGRSSGHNPGSCLRALCAQKCGEDDEPDHRMRPPKAQDSEVKFLENQPRHKAAFFAGHKEALAANAGSQRAGLWSEVLQC